jgi:hypothetical protein
LEYKMKETSLFKLEKEGWFSVVEERWILS